MSYQRPQYEFPIHGIAWTRGAGAPAGFFLLEGEMHLVAHGSPAEFALRVRGALHVADVRFEEQRSEPPHRGLKRLAPSEALVRFGHHS